MILHVATRRSRGTLPLHTTSFCACRLASYPPSGSSASSLRSCLFSSTLFYLLTARRMIIIDHCDNCLRFMVDQGYQASQCIILSLMHLFRRTRLLGCADVGETYPAGLSPLRMVLHADWDRQRFQKKSAGLAGGCGCFSIDLAFDDQRHTPSSTVLVCGRAHTMHDAYLAVRSLLSSLHIVI